MKLICILIVVSTPGVRASGYGQEIYLSMKNAKIEKVLDEISKQIQLRFFYDKELLGRADRVDLSATKADVRSVLNRILKGQNLAYEIVDGTIVIKERKKTDIEVTGVVRDSVGVMPGVTVSVLGVPGLTTKTGGDGGYSLRAPEKSVLLFRFIGYKDLEVVVGSQSVMCRWKSRSRIWMR